MDEETKDIIEQKSSIMQIETDSKIHVELDKSKSVSEQAQDIVTLAATARAVEDEQLVENITDYKKAELLTHAETELKDKTVKSKESEIKLQQANYGVYSGIADLIGLKKPLPNKMLNALMFILMPMLIIYYVVFGFISGVINITMDCVNSIVTRFADFTSPAKKVISFVLITILSISVILIVYYILHKYDIIKF